MSKKILVIGATGRVGSELVKLLIQNGKSVRIATRNPITVSSRSQNTIDVVEFDYERPQTFAPALVGIEKIFLTGRLGTITRIKLQYLLSTKQRRRKFNISWI